MSFLLPFLDASSLPPLFLLRPGDKHLTLSLYSAPSFRFLVSNGTNSHRSNILPMKTLHITRCSRKFSILIKRNCIFGSRRLFGRIRPTHRCNETARIFASLLKQKARGRKRALFPTYTSVGERGRHVRTFVEFGPLSSLFRGDDITPQFPGTKARITTRAATNLHLH